jgi:hypothetical protein
VPITAAAKPIAPLKVTKKNKSGTSKKKPNLDSFSTFSDESKESSVYGEIEGSEVGE